MNVKFYVLQYRNEQIFKDKCQIFVQYMAALQDILQSDGEATEMQRSQ